MNNNFRTLILYSLLGMISLQAFTAISAAAMAPSFFTVSNTIIDTGQYTYFTTTSAFSGGGTGVYNGNWAWNGPTASGVANANTIQATVTSSDNALLATFFNTNSISFMFPGLGSAYTNTINTVNPKTLAGLWTFNTIVADSANALNAIIISNTVTIFATPFTATPTASNTIFDSGQSTSITTTLTGGSSTLTSNAVFSNGVVANTLFGVAAGSYSFKFAPTTSSGTTYTINGVGVDTGTTTPFAFNSVQLTLVENAVSITFNNASLSLVGGSVVAFNAYVAGGFNINYQWFLSSSGTSGTFSAYNGGTGGTYNGLYIGSLPGGTYYFKLRVTDTGTTTQFVTNSTIIQVGVGGGGGGGGGGGSTTSTSTSTSTSSTTTSTVPTTTTPPAPQPINIAGVSGSSIFILTTGAAQTVNYPSGNATVVVTNNGTATSNYKFMISGTSGSALPSAPANYNILQTFNVSVNTTASMSVTMHYPCGLPSSSVVPFMLSSKGVWKTVASAGGTVSVNAAACSVTFTVPKDPVVGLMQYQAPATTTISSTATTTSSTSGGSGSTSASSSSSTIYWVIGIVVVIIIVVGYMMTRKKR